MDALLFVIDDRRCALPLEQVAEVIPAVNVDAVPGSPAILEGVVNVRGEVLPVLSLRARLGMPARDVRAAEYFVIARSPARRVILRSDTVPTIFELPALPRTRGEEVDRAISAVVPLPDGLAHLLDVDSFLAEIGDPVLEAVLTDAGVAA